MLSSKTKKYNKEKPIARDAEDIQNDIFRKMPVSKKLLLTSEFSAFLLKLNKLNSKYGISKTWIK